MGVAPSSPATRSPVSVPGPSGRRPWSTLLLREYAAKQYAGLQMLEQYRLGPTVAELVGVHVTPALEAMLRVNNWYADGVIFAPDRTIVIEAKVKPTPSAVGQVLYYLRLLPATPSMATRLNLPLHPVVLFAENDSGVTMFARGMGCEVAVYTPSWIADYLTQVQYRNRATAGSGASQGSGDENTGEAS